MSSSSSKIGPDLVSVIIPSYNHGNYLPEAIESVYTQKGMNTEIIVVDDGSTDDTRLVVQQFPFVKYIYQSNQGLSAARNTGIDNSTGNYLVFLDADDWLLEDALSINLQCFKKENSFAFVSGAYKYVFEKIGKTIDIFKEVTANHYQQFLVCNYIGMHAAVMYQRWAFDSCRFDTSLKASEDYDMFLKLARKYPVFHHTQPIAAYRIHGTNMSANIPMMLTYTLKVLKRQEPFLQNESERHLFYKGMRCWKKWYCGELYKKLHPRPIFTNNNSHAEIGMLWEHDKSLLLRYFLIYQVKLAKWTIKKIIPDFMSRRLHKAGFYPNYIPAPGKVNKGDFDRTSPFSEEFGYDRGGPIDRYYIENFLFQHASVIKGRVLEIGDSAYTLRFGGSKVLQSDVLNLTQSPDTTFVGDLSNAPQIPQDTFDCIILTQTLHLIYDYKAALQTCYRILKPGGTLLLTVPGISQIDHGRWEKYWLWSFTKRSIEQILSEVFAGRAAIVKSYGNVLVASAFLYGMGAPELNQHQLDYFDKHYQLVISAAVKKPNQKMDELVTP
jgi:glycosyltransferase involved in cell wall biosynthesis